jgi:hypothetical protein
LSARLARRDKKAKELSASLDNDMDEQSTAVCECVVWREGERRCEFWLISGRAHLRVFEGHRLLREEPAERYGAYVRAQELHASAAALGDAPPLDHVSVPPLTTPDDTEGG